MKWTPIMRRNGYALLTNECMAVVAHNYNPDAPENEQWSAGQYFYYWDPQDKPESLSMALDYFRSRTEEDYIPRPRLEELCTKFKDKFIEVCMDTSMSDGDVVYELEELDLQSNEREWLGFQADTDL